MYCREYDELFGEYALGNAAELSPAQRERAEAHLKECASCREALEGEKQFYASLRRVHEAMQCVAVPREIVEQTTRRVRAAVQNCKRASLALKFAVACTGMAAAVLLATLLLPRDDAEPSVPGPVVKRHVAPRPEKAPVVEKPQAMHEMEPPVAERPKQAPNEAREKLHALKARLAAAEDGGKGRPYYEETAEAASRIVVDYPDTLEALDAQYLVYQANYAMVELNRAYDAFEEYLEIAEKVKGEDYAAREANREGDRVYRGKQYVESLFYYGLAADKYSGSEQAARAQLMAGKSYSAMGEGVAAEKLYWGLIEDHPDSPRAQKARLMLRLIYANTGRYDEAIAVLDEYEEKGATEAQKARAKYLKAIVATTRKDPVAAMRLLAGLDKCKDANIRSQATALLASLKRKALKDVEEDLGLE